jgi:hypothetical protein
LFFFRSDSFAQKRHAREALKIELRTRCFICDIEASRFDRAAGLLQRSYGFNVRVDLSASSVPVYHGLLLGALPLVCGSLSPHQLFLAFCVLVFAMALPQLHRDHEHNIWNYLAYYCYITAKREALSKQRPDCRDELAFDGTERYMNACYLNGTYPFYPDGQSRTLQQVDALRKTHSERRDQARVRLLPVVSSFQHLSLFFLVAYGDITDPFPFFFSPAHRSWPSCAAAWPIRRASSSSSAKRWPRVSSCCRKCARTPIRSRSRRTRAPAQWPAAPRTRARSE